LHSAREETAALTEQNDYLEKHAETLIAKYHSTQTQLSEANIRATELERALQDLTNKAAAERASNTLRFSRAAVQNACRHAVTTHESRREFKALRHRYENELAAVELSWQGGHELNAFLHATASEMDEELAQQRIVVSVAHKIHWRRAMKSLYSWRDYAKSGQARRHRMRQAVNRMGKVVAMNIVRAWADLIRTMKIDDISAALQSATECRRVENLHTRALETKAQAQDTLLGHIATKLDRSSTIQAMVIQELKSQPWKGDTMQDERLATTLVERAFSAALVREAEETSQERVLVAAAQKTKIRAMSKCIRAWCYVTFERTIATSRCNREQTETPERHTAAQQHVASVRAREHDQAQDEVPAGSLARKIFSIPTMNVAETIPSQMSPSLPDRAGVLDSDGTRLAALKAGLTECSERLSALECARTLV
jgi:hypothetical protein